MSKFLLFDYHAAANRAKGNRVDISKAELAQKSVYCRLSGRDMDVMEMTAYGDCYKVISVSDIFKDFSIQNALKGAKLSGLSSIHVAAPFLTKIDGSACHFQIYIANLHSFFTLAISCTQSTPASPLAIYSSISINGYLVQQCFAGYVCQRSRDNMRGQRQVMCIDEGYQNVRL
ncbi:hypothetical protein GOP47_0022056 [Adiantum capillus-veneris]|uniref:Uncharacterized protein n=1 Tax=Adiantum capillus-veneris TaxID=13818 RepID=A0A9D4UAC1_ADICA|nr:hypothetical protein GOP47_0022056 [Adiantum capillus-veneris]